MEEMRARPPESRGFWGALLNCEGLAAEPLNLFRRCSTGEDCGRQGAHQIRDQQTSCCPCRRQVDMALNSFCTRSQSSIASRGGACCTFHTA